MSEDKKPSRSRGVRAVKPTMSEIEKLSLSGPLPITFLGQIYQDESKDLELRVECAKAVAPYVHPKLSAVHVQANATEMTHEEWLDSLS